MAIRLFFFPWYLSIKDWIFSFSRANVIPPLGRINPLADKISHVLYQNGIDFVKPCLRTGGNKRQRKCSLRFLAAQRTFPNRLRGHVDDRGGRKLVDHT